MRPKNKELKFGIDWIFHTLSFMVNEEDPLVRWYSSFPSNEEITSHNEIALTDRGRRIAGGMVKLAKQLKLKEPEIGRRRPDLVQVNQSFDTNEINPDTLAGEVSHAMAELIQLRNENIQLKNKLAELQTKYPQDFEKKWHEDFDQRKRKAELRESRKIKRIESNGSEVSKGKNELLDSDGMETREVGEELKY